MGKTPSAGRTPAGGGDQAGDAINGAERQAARDAG